MAFGQRCNVEALHEVRIVLLGLSTLANVSDKIYAKQFAAHSI